MAGSFFSGAIFNKINTRLLFFSALSGLGVASIVAPYCSMYPLMIFIEVIIGFFAGTIEVSGNTWHMSIWGSEGNVLMQILQFSFAFGGVLAPLYTEPFLAKRKIQNETDTDNVTTGNLSDLYLLPDSRSTDVHYAYLITGLFMICASIPFLVLFFKQRSPNTQSIGKQNDNTIVTYRKLPLCLHIFILMTICLFFLLYCCIETSFSSFLMAFLINEFESMTKSEGVYITTIYWMSFAISRFIMIFISKLLSSVQLLSLCILLMSVAFVGFFISVVFEVVVAVGVFTALAGLGMSGVYAAGFSWTETELLKVTSRVSASIGIIAAIGSIVIPLIIGFLMDEVSNMWFCYLLLGQTVVMFLIFIFLFFFIRRFIIIVYGPMSLLEHCVENDSKQLGTELSKDDYKTIKNI
ncbi:unnamed protein product [Candidula unifasciata]|uniref:Sodium-dependent glucose transporter 1-like protein n=1 Tax=Candidula unifasciata TaxID=100452 RepID=A0A8S3Z9P6_9EUPU|nr:unnamed protein product [Candidula unifasciata]